MAVESFDYLIVGGGLAGGWAVEGIRERDPKGTICLISAESDPPYDRPPLSKQLWKGEQQLDQIFIHPRSYYAEQRVDLRLGTRVTGLDRSRHLATCADGKTVTYRKLLLATGGSPRRLSIPGGDLDGLCYYRTAADYRHLRQQVEPGRTAVVIGGGFIGSELAAALTMNGAKVTMVFPEPYLVSRVFPPGLGQALNGAYRTKGVDVIAEDIPTAIAIQDDGFQVTTRGGKTLSADIVIVGIGIAPNLELAQAAGLKTGNGIVVNSYLQTSDPDIYAAGDIAFFPEAVLGARRIEHWDCAVTQGKHAGRNLAGANAEFTDLPFFYSDLFEFGYEAVGEVDSRLETFTDWQEENKTGVIYYLGDGKVRGAMMCNVWGKVDDARALIREQIPVRPTDLKGRIA